MNRSNIILNKSKQVPEVYIKLDVPLLQFIKKKKKQHNHPMIKNKKTGTSPMSVAKTPCFHRRGHRFNPCLGN